jgi:hypothetical protein
MKASRHDSQCEHEQYYKADWKYLPRIAFLDYNLADPKGHVYYLDDPAMAPIPKLGNSDKTKPLSSLQIIDCHDNKNLCIATEDKELIAYKLCKSHRSNVSPASYCNTGLTYSYAEPCIPEELPCLG